MWVAQATLRHRAGDESGARGLLERALVAFEELGTLDEPARVRAMLNPDDEAGRIVESPDSQERGEPAGTGPAQVEP
jgi:hypothetical protein